MKKKIQKKTSVYSCANSLRLSVQNEAPKIPWGLQIFANMVCFRYKKICQELKDVLNIFEF